MYKDITRKKNWNNKLRHLLHAFLYNNNFFLNLQQKQMLNANLSYLCRTKVQRDLRSVMCDNFHINTDWDSPIAVAVMVNHLNNVDIYYKIVGIGLDSQPTVWLIWVYFSVVKF